MTTNKKENNMNQHEFFTVDEVALMRFMTICHQTCDPEMWKTFENLARKLIKSRRGLRDDCFERIEAYLNVAGTEKWPTQQT